MRKQLELILTALLPVMVLVIGFFVATSKAGLNNVETADPAEAGPFYRTPGSEHDGEEMHFGPEIYSTTLCPGGDDFNVGFDIYVTWENADVWIPQIPNAVHWYRFQRWDFTSEDTPWGTNTAEITLDDDIGWEGENLGDSFPWNGYESHSRSIIDDEVRVYSSSDVTTWGKYTVGEKKFICPMFHKVGKDNNRGYDVKYSCDLGRTLQDTLIRVREGDFGPFEFVDAEQQIRRRWADKTQRWYYCLKLVEEEEE